VRAAAIGIGEVSGYDSTGRILSHPPELQAQLRIKLTLFTSDWPAG